MFSRLIYNSLILTKNLCARLLHNHIDALPQCQTTLVMVVGGFKGGVL